MKLVLCDTKTYWDDDKAVREKLRAATRRGHKMHWDVRISGTWHDLYMFSVYSDRMTAILVWTGSLSELLMVKLADPDNHIIDIMDVPEDHPLFAKLAGRNSKKQHYLSWNKILHDVDFSFAPPVMKELYVSSMNNNQGIR